VVSRLSNFLATYFLERDLKSEILFAAYGDVPAQGCNTEIVLYCWILTDIVFAEIRYARQTLITTGGVRVITLRHEASYIY